MPGEPANSTNPIEIHRLKSRLVFKDGSVKMVQGVREIFEIFDGQKVETTGQGISKQGKIVLIGRGLQQVDFERSFLDAVRAR